MPAGELTVFLFSFSGESFTGTHPLTHAGFVPALVPRGLCRTVLFGLGNRKVAKRFAEHNSVFANGTVSEFVMSPHEGAA